MDIQKDIPTAIFWGFVSLMLAGVTGVVFKIVLDWFKIKTQQNQPVIDQLDRRVSGLETGMKNLNDAVIKMESASIVHLENIYKIQTEDRKNIEKMFEVVEQVSRNLAILTERIQREPEKVITMKNTRRKSS